jgi:DNA-binding XRE family transcriptional regulator
MTDEFYYFQVLPVHPQPEPFESLTSYVTRLAEENAIKSPLELCKLLFPDMHPSGLRYMADALPTSVEQLSMATLCSTNRIKQTTFAHLCKKFGRLETAKPGMRFLSGAISDELRYCPECISEKGYYSLLWRFNFITHCSEHECALTTGCQKCGNAIPFLAPPYAIGKCPSCGSDFCKGQSQVRRDESNVLYVRELEYLLLPQEFEQNALEVVKQLGTILMWLRSEKGLLRHEVAKQIKISYEAIALIEHGKQKVGFINIFKYKKLFNL